MIGNKVDPGTLAPNGHRPIPPRPFPERHGPDLEERPLPARRRQQLMRLAAPTASTSQPIKAATDVSFVDAQWRTAVVDNLSDQWLLIIEAGPRWIPPWQVGVVCILNGSNTCTAQWTAPPGIAQVSPIKSYSPDAGLILLLENEYPPHPGYNILSVMQTLYNIT